ncbi:NAD(P)H-dependent glycerol-3-phosphate dehydrogenase [Rhizobium sp. EC-SD404]|uniref:NAD(P)H-dependent glycerol-3-phosphate dehydrogenase n=1 Tax=Rhizobium sp. EC-SD404 TaxID=2038389 RepID=UPI0012513947|nr:NAD(P)H-dependent glycerol-3-phosphate dehydrogenase [Rhizobium sp. EC-SD404]VVT00143.1 Glycerol-3-phosphate dehydrogenase (NAD(P)+) [Rhizobium sp. EC-SD404]
MSAPDLAIVGAGAFGTALACTLARSRSEPLVLYARNAAQVTEMRETRTNARFLPGIPLPERIELQNDLTALAGVHRILVAVPAQAQGEMIRALRPHVGSECELVICAKGIERASHRFLSEVAAEAAPGLPISVLSGPGFAADMANGLPTAMTLASADRARAEATSAALSGDSFRLYASGDVAGVEIGGALKNVLAIAAGIVDGAALGQSARAALIARGLAEMTRFAAAFGGKAETIAGLSGLGDLVLTATSEQSRNFRFGRAIGQGVPPKDLSQPGQPLTEGAFTAAVACDLARQAGIELPIANAVSDVIEGRLTVGQAMEHLMRRPLRSEDATSDQVAEDLTDRSPRAN